MKKKKNENETPIKVKSRIFLSTRNVKNDKTISNLKSKSKTSSKIYIEAKNTKEINGKKILFIKVVKV